MCRVQFTVGSGEKDFYLRLYLTEFIYQLVSQSQLPRKFGNVLFMITNQNIKLTVLGGS